MSEIKVPEMGESLTEGTISTWIVKVGDPVQQGDLLLELETDKVNMEVSALVSGVIDEIRKNSGDTVRVGEVIGTIREGAAVNDKSKNADSPKLEGTVREPESQSQRQGEEAGGKRSDVNLHAATPSARKMARERGIDLQHVSTSDLNGRIHRSDVARVDAVTGSEPPAAASSQRSAPLPSSGENVSKAQADHAAKPIEIVRMSRRRLTIASRLVEAQRTAAMLTTFNEVDMTTILDIRQRRKQSFKDKHEVGLGFMSFFTKAVVRALKAFPLLNAEIDGEQIILKKYYDIGIAVAAKEGLVVPVIREADRLSFAEIEKRIVELADRARSNTLQLSDLQGGSFSITNGGVFGSLLSTPILNTPQVGILGMHKIQWRPIAIDEERMENRPMMYIALSYDHRIVDGSEAVRFLVLVKELLEDSESLLLEG
ncbi:2-oxoglutarate dehydrogenase E2 component [Paenibacillus sp. yr247]|uniref:2-oxoglutarate dehydrogenase complex dihydrolipoyllysine-residue succinyltransferase n=1 Tax=Paenibacillus sp. yr247 TaxID=1761880 RepID=UPI00088C6954|nr:2-oxoglutarate dehydrogenase complex dihydrolipoyllysine-residue succinyltransferase [Paenibacillus sp. yr247]SDO12459.1 2-oxoglutarate dehydrogenase E2 component [Paenibacillus sp. yr247]